MTKFEKVIKGLENCKEGGSCDGCQYDINFSKCIFLLHADALALLKEQETVEYALEVLRKAGWKETHDVPFPVELLKEQQQTKSKEEVLAAIISTQGYTDVETFKRTVLEIDNFEDCFLGGLFRAVKAVEKLFETH